MKLSSQSENFLKNLASQSILTYEDLRVCITIWETEHNTFTESALRVGRWKHGGKPTSIAALNEIISDSTGKVSPTDIAKISAINDARINRLASTSIHSSRSDVEIIFSSICEVITNIHLREQRNLTKDIDVVMNDIYQEYLKMSIVSSSVKVIDFFTHQLIKRGSSYSMDGNMISLYEVNERAYLTWHLRNILGYNQIEEIPFRYSPCSIITQRIYNFQNDVPVETRSSNTF